MDGPSFDVRPCATDPRGCSRPDGAGPGIAVVHTHFDPLIARVRVEESEQRLFDLMVNQFGNSKDATSSSDS